MQFLVFRAVLCYWASVSYTKVPGDRLVIGGCCRAPTADDASAIANFQILQYVYDEYAMYMYILVYTYTTIPCMTLYATCTRTVGLG